MKLKYTWLNAEVLLYYAGEVKQIVADVKVSTLFFPVCIFYYSILPQTAVMRNKPYIQHIINANYHNAKLKRFHSYWQRMREKAPGQIKNKGKQCLFCCCHTQKYRSEWRKLRIQLCK